MHDAHTNTASGVAAFSCEHIQTALKINGRNYTQPFCLTGTFQGVFHKHAKPPTGSTFAITETTLPRICSTRGK